MTSIAKTDVKNEGGVLEQVKMKTLIQVATRWIPSVLLIIAAILLIQSIEKPYWNMHLDAPQYDYRGGLDIIVYIDSMEGKDPKFDELRELNGLNHYIGMRPLEEAAEFERSIAIPAVYTFAGILVFVAFAAAWRGRFRRWLRWSWLLVLAPMAFPAVFVGDLYYWLRDSGQNLDPNAPFSSSIHPFTPPTWGEGKVGQFYTISSLDEGWYLALYAAILIGVAMLIALVHFFITRNPKSMSDEVAAPPTSKLETEASHA